jgi:hypothetical protein
MLTKRIDKLKLANQTNSTLQLGNTVLNFSAINIPNKLGKAGGQLSAVIETIIVLQIIGIACSGLLIIITPLNLFIEFFRKWWFVPIVASLTFLATGCFVVVTTLETGINFVIRALVHEVADGLGVEAYGGDELLVILWIKFIFMAASSTVWFCKWHNARYVVREKEVRRPAVATARSNFPAIYRSKGPPPDPPRERAEATI